MNKHILKRILEYTKPYKMFLISAIVSALISVCALLYIPVLIGKSIDNVVGK